MPPSYIVTNMKAALLERIHPAITRWNRLEGRPRTHDFARALKAEVRDALWFLSKQWQMGEFKGEDAGSPVLARICVDLGNIDRFQAGHGAVEPIPASLELESRVERRPLPLRLDAQYLSLDLRMAVGRRWLKLLARDVSTGDLSADYSAQYVGLYKVVVPDPGAPADALVCAHPESWQAAGLAAGRAMDGIGLLEYLAQPGHAAADGIGGVTPGDAARLATLADALRSWFVALVEQPPPGGDSAWQPDRLEYQFGCSAPDGDRAFVMRAEEYYQGRLDWYALDQSPGEAQLGDTSGEPGSPRRLVNTFIPTSIVFEGMPNTRWWAFEDRRTNFGDVRPDSTDLGKLLLLEFGLVYANDWFILPYTMPVSTVAAVKGIAVTNVFGERFWIEPLRASVEPDWQQWTLFTLTAGAAGNEGPPPPQHLVLLPTPPKVQEGGSIEEISLIRDEVANLVWGIEQRVPLASGAVKPGTEAAREYHAWLQGLVTSPSPPPPPTAPIRYEVMNSIPENWIPFIAVHVAGDARETQLQRAAMPRILEGDPNPPGKVRPRTSLLRVNLPKAYFVHEEEVPRAGAVVSLSYQRTRRMDGAAVTWLAARKQTGRGEGSSGLRFDDLVPMI
jgi:hypothetical protein